MKFYEFDEKEKRVDIFSERWYRHPETGKFYRSVTTILGVIDKGYQYDEWLKNNGHNAEIIVDRAGRFGTDFHKLVERFLKGETVSYADIAYQDEKTATSLWERFNIFFRFWQEYKEKHTVKIIDTELITYSEEYEYAGTIDLTCMVDVCIPLGKGSKHGDMELKYCLRSIEKNVRNVGKIFLVGQKPAFLNDQIIHIAQPFVSGNPAQNIAMNVLAACKCWGLSERFQLWNDDYFATGEIDAANYPNFYKCDLSETLAKNRTDYRKHVHATIEVLKRQGHETLNFDVHYPSTFEKSKMIEVIEGNNFSKPFGLILKSLYFNTTGEAGILRKDCKEMKVKSLSDWRKTASDTELFSCFDSCIDQAFKDFLQETFPNKSSFEN